MILAQALTNIFVKFDKNAGTSEVLINEQVSVRGQLLCLHAKTSQRRNRALTDPGTFRAKAHSKTQNSPVAPPPPSPWKGRSLWFLQLSGTTYHGYGQKVDFGILYRHSKFQNCLRNPKISPKYRRFSLVNQFKNTHQKLSIINGSDGIQELGRVG